MKRRTTLTAAAGLAERQAEDARIANNLQTFGILGFQVFSNQQRGRVH